MSTTTTKPKPTIIMPTAAELRKIKAESEAFADQQFARALRYDRKAKTFVLQMRSGAIVHVPIAAIKDLADATPAQLTRVELSPVGDAISQRELDVDIYVPGMLRRVLGFDAAHRRAGSVKTPAKAAAARANGAKGGRPRKRPVEA